MSVRRPARRRRLARTAAALALAAVGLILLHARLLTGVADFMTVEDRLEASDAILPLYHHPSVPLEAARLYRAGYATHILLPVLRADRLEEMGLVRPSHEQWRSLLEAQGVPAHAITTFGEGLLDERQIGRSLASSSTLRRGTRIIVVAWAPWSRLSRDSLRRGTREAPFAFLMHPVRFGPFDESSWWRARPGWVTYFDVYVMWMLRFLRPD